MNKMKRQESRRGFTLIELLVGSTVMLIIIVGTLSLYMRSNKVAVDQNMYAELQHDVRSAMYFITRDIRMSGVGLPIEFQQYYFEGTDNEDQGGGVEVTPDRLLIMGNIEDPLNLSIQDYNGSSITLGIDDYSFEQFPYPDEYYENKICLILPNPASGCRFGQVRQLTHVTHSTGGTNEKLNFSPGLAPGINPPGGLSGYCGASSDYIGGLVTFIDVKEFWLDITGNYLGLTAGVNGYIGNGQGDILYMTLNGIHYPISQDVENLQFEYNGDLDNDGDLDGFLPWQNTWLLDEIGRIREIRILVQGRTPRAFVSVSGNPDPNRNVYQRPPLSNTAGGAQPDRHRRFLLESTSNIRNLSLNLYNSGTR
ncbi:MAG: prepilin-type N-terminal cleavage/methylation domain-containing protein [Candidatus Aminicenantales bacterium]